MADDAAPTSKPKGMRPLSARGIPDGAIVALATFAILAALALNFLRFHHYPLFSPEVGIVALVVAALALLFGLVYHFLPRLLRALLEAGLIAFLVSIYTLHPLALASAIIFPFVFVLVTRRSLLPFLGFAAFVAAAAATVGIGQQEQGPAIARSAPGRAPPVAAPARPAPILVHIILDEHVGVEGLPAGHPGSADLKQTLKAFYVPHGFRLFGRAHSEYFDTVDSIPHMLNLGGVAVEELPRTDRNAYFDFLRANGYALHVYRPDMLDLCRGQQVASCTTYLPESFHTVSASPLTPGNRAELILLKFSRLGRLYRTLRQKDVPLPEFDFEVEGRVVPLNTLELFDTFIADLRRAKPGEAYVAHVLLPHYPYATEPNCAIKNRSPWRTRDLGPLRDRHDAYFDQIRCTLSKVEASYEAVSVASGGNFIMIVHGDHGSRIVDVDPRLRNLKRLHDRDLLAGFSTLFAVRAPSVAAGYDGTPCSLAALLSGVVRTGLRSGETFLPQCPPPTAHVQGGDWKTAKRVPLPKSW